MGGKKTEKFEKNGDFLCTTPFGKYLFFKNPKMDQITAVSSKFCEVLREYRAKERDVYDAALIFAQGIFTCENIYYILDTFYSVERGFRPPTEYVETCAMILRTCAMILYEMEHEYRCAQAETQIRCAHRVLRASGMRERFPEVFRECAPCPI